MEFAPIDGSMEGCGRARVVSVGQTVSGQESSSDEQELIAPENRSRVELAAERDEVPDGEAMTTNDEPSGSALVGCRE